MVNQHMSPVLLPIFTSTRQDIPANDTRFYLEFCLMLIVDIFSVIVSFDFVLNQRTFHVP